MPRVMVVAAALVDDLNAPRRLLAARRTRPAHVAGRWELPGGKVEPNEDPIDALHREIDEELGVRIRLGVEVPGPDGRAWPVTTRHHMRVWFAQVIDGTPQPLEVHDELRWLEHPDWHRLDWLDGDVPLIAALSTWAIASHGTR
jgi:8-oxo-dGTP diphosphatase